MFEFLFLLSVTIAFLSITTAIFDATLFLIEHVTRVRRKRKRWKSLS